MDVMQKSQGPHIIAEHQRYKNKQTNKQTKNHSNTILIHKKLSN